MTVAVGVAVVAGGLTVAPASAEPTASAEAVDAGYTADVESSTDESLWPEVGAERVELRTANTKTFTTETAGRFRTLSSPLPLHFQAASGDWDEIDARLVASVGGLRSAANAFAVEIPLTAAAASIATLRVDDDHAIGFGLTGALPVAVDQPTPTEAVFSSVLPGVSIELTSLPTGLKEEIVLESNLAPNTFVFPLLLEGVTAEVVDGEVLFRDAARTVRATTPRGFMVDSASPRGAEAFSSEVSYEIVPLGAGEALKVTVSRAWLDDPARVYPVRIDPTLHVGNNGSASYRNPCGWSESPSPVRVGNARPCNGGDAYWRSVMYYPYESLFGKQLLGARLRLYNRTEGTQNAYATAITHATQWGWDCVRGGYQQSANGENEQNFYNDLLFNIYNDAINWGEGGRAICFVGYEAPGLYTYKRFDGNELYLDWQDPNQAPNVPDQRNPGHGWIGTSSPTLSARYTDPNGGSGNVDFEVAGVCFCPVATSHGNTAYYNPGVGDGVYSWRVRAWDGSLHSAWSDWWTFTVDGTAPTPPAVSVSPHSSATTWYSNNAPAISWSASDTSGITAYRYDLDTNATTNPTTETTGTSRSYSGLADGVHYFHVKAKNGANLWGNPTHRAIRVDKTAPTAPTTVTSSSHTPNAYSKDRNISVSWSGASDATSGVKDYVWTFNNSQTTAANPSTDARTSGTSASSGSVSDGTWWFHVRSVDHAGNVSSDRTYGPFHIDGTGPDAPVISSITHDQDTWTANRTAEFTWTAPADASPLDGYRVRFDNSPTTDPQDTDDWTAVPAWTELDVPDGEHWLHVRAKDAAGNLGATAHYRVRVDGSAPGPVPVSSATHPDQSEWYDNRDPIFDWTAPAESGSGVAGYSYAINQVENYELDTSIETTGLSATFANLDDGRYWFHVRAVDNAGNAGPVTRYQMSIHLLVDAEPREDLDAVGPGLSVTMPPVPDIPAAAPPPPGGLPDLFPNTNMFGTTPLFGGEVLPNAAAADALRHAFSAARPAAAATPDAGAVLADGLRTVRELPRLPLVFDVLDVATYQVTTTRYESGGATSTRQDVFAACVPTSYHSRDGLVTVDPDLRINLCPDPSSLSASRQQLDYQLDALKNGVRVKVTATYQPAGKQLLVVTNAQQTDHPAAFAALLATEPGADEDQTNTIETSSSSRLDSFQLELRQVGTNGTVPEGRVTIGALPAGTGRRYEIYGQDASDSRRTLTARIVVDGAGSNPGEWLSIERFDPAAGGDLTGRLRLSNYPSQLTTALTSQLRAGVAFADADPIALDLTGDQGAARTAQTLVVEQWAGGRLLGLLTAADFATQYNYHAAVFTSTGTADTGARVTASFPAGAPPDGRLQVARYRSDNGSDVLDSLIDLNGFATATAFEADRPTATTLDLDIDNTTSVSGQLIQVLQLPDGAAPVRVVLAGADAPAARISAPVPGRNLRWDTTPRSHDTTFAYVEDPGGTSGRQLTVAGTASDGPTSGRIELTEATSDGTVGLVVKAPTANHYLDISFTGTLSDVQGARVIRHNNGARPEHALQLYLKDTQGLRSQMTMRGASSTTTGLEPGAGRDIDANLTGMPAESYEYGLAVDTTPTKRSAVISGANPTDAPGMDARVTAQHLGLDLHQASFPAAFDYRFDTDFDDSGNVTAARISGTQSGDNPSGLIELGYSDLKAVIRSLTATFTYQAIIEGTIDNPESLIFTQRQSSPNPASLLQLARYDGTTPRAAVTLRNSANGVLPEAASVLDVLWTDTPKDFDLRFGRHPDVATETIEALITTGGVDLPGADIVVRRYETGEQQLAIHGIAPETLLSIDMSRNATDPRKVYLDTAATIRHSTDRIELRNLTAGAVTHTFRLLGTTGTDTGANVEARFDNLPEGLDLRIDRVKDSGGQDRSYNIQLTQHTVGATTADRTVQANPDSAFRVDFRENVGSPEFLWLRSGLPADFRLGYERPPATVQAPDPADNNNAARNCLGTFTYDRAAVATLNLRFQVWIDNNCLRGPITAEIEGMPASGFATAALRMDGEAEFATHPGQQVGKLHVTTPPPVGEEAFLNRDVNVPAGKLLCPRVFGIAQPINVGCITLNEFRAKPQFIDLKVIVTATGLEHVTLKTNYDHAGNPKPYPGSGDDIDHFLWEHLPILAVHYDGTGDMKIQVTGDDDSSRHGAELVQDIYAWIATPKNRAAHREFLDLDDQPLRVRFYGWVLGADGSKRNLVGQQLSGDEMWDHVKLGCCTDDLPFQPRFIAGAQAPAPKDINSMQIAPGQTMYLVPNLYDAMLSHVPSADDVTGVFDIDDTTRGRWFAKNRFNIWQADWYFQILLHQIEPDLHSLGT